MQLRTDFNYLLLNLILTELAMSGLAIPVDAIASYQLGWKMGSLMCQIVGFGMTFLGEWLILQTLQCKACPARDEHHDLPDVYLPVPLDSHF